MKVTQETLKEIIPEYNIKAIKCRLRKQYKYGYQITDHNYLNAVKMCKKNDLYNIDKKNHSDVYLLIWIIYFASTAIVCFANVFHEFSDTFVNTTFSLFCIGSAALAIILCVIWHIQRWRFNPLTVSDEIVLGRYKRYTIIPTMIEDFDKDDIAEAIHDLDKYDYAFCRSEYPDAEQYYLPVLYAVYLNDMKYMDINIPFKANWDIQDILYHYRSSHDWYGWGELNNYVEKCYPEFNAWTEELANLMDR